MCGSCMTSYALCFLVIQVKLSNSRTSWRLNADKVVRVATTSTEFLPSAFDDDVIFDILTGSTINGNGQGWSRSAAQITTTSDKFQVYCNECKSNTGNNNKERYKK